LSVKIKFEGPGENLAELLYQNRARWHKSCHLKFSSSKLIRVETQQKRKLTKCAPNDDKNRIEDDEHILKLYIASMRNAYKI